MQKITKYLYLHLLLFISSLSGVFSKLAAQHDFLSFKFLVFYGVALCIMGIYALFWQQVLKNFNLTTAFLNKSVTIIWGALLGCLIFNETVSLPMIIGMIVILAGVCLVVTSDE